MATKKAGTMCRPRETTPLSSPCLTALLDVFELYKDGNFKLTSVGSDLLGEDQQPQYMVPPYVWFRLYPTNDYAISIDGAVKVHKAEPRDADNHHSFLGATCIPAFQIEDAEVAKRAEFIS
ncbi:hypothetical protein ACJRO7_013845 [Eucalyptus globulus]|uniref:DUF985 domain-containing protein n=1 Tax=Eucalyptus globulus TaxID=34317 RepID=A0ABD3KZ53_EUCGL